VQRRSASFRLGVLGYLLAVPAILALVGCQGVSSASKQSTTVNAGPGQLAVAPTMMSFGNLALGSKSAQKGTLTAGTTDITVSSAAWNGQGYALSGITFPVTVPAGQSVSFSVTFDPQAPGSAPGTVAFVSDATNSPTTETFTGNGTQQQQSSHSVALSWNPSSSQVIGYNVYRRASGGSYAKINPSVSATTSYTDSSVQSGTTYDYVTTAIDSSNVESAYSNQATATIP
jgi:hypothetical protein